MNQLYEPERVRIIACLVEGNSLRGAARITGHHRTTIMRLLVRLGKTCAELQSDKFKNLSCKRIECDEIWAFVGCKEKNIKKKTKKKTQGDIWTWTAIDSDTKLVPYWHVGDREVNDAVIFIHGLKACLANRVQLTTDGYSPYKIAVEEAFGSEIDYGQLVKVYGFMEKRHQARYSKSKLVEARKIKVTGRPNRKLISTSICERNNFTMRMGMRRFTRLTNAFSKKIENHKHAVALHFMHYNFCRIHGSLRVTPAMAAGVSDHVWGLEELIKLLN